LNKIDALLSILENGDWHTLNEMARLLKINPTVLEETLRFLGEHDLIKYDEETRKAKMNQAWKTLLLTEPEEKTQKEVVGTIIIPHKETLTIQQTRISNLTGADIELEVRIKGRISEITITRV